MINTADINIIKNKIGNIVKTAADYYELNFDTEELPLNEFYYHITDKDQVSVQLFFRIIDTALTCKIVTYFYSKVNPSNKDALKFIIRLFKRNFQSNEKIRFRDEYMIFIKKIRIEPELSEGDKNTLLLNLLDTIFHNKSMELIIDSILKELYEMPEELIIN